MNNIVNFEIAKLLLEKGYDTVCSSFYTKPRSKMFGIDEHGRHYPIVNTPKKLYILGEHAVVNIENVYQAPIIAEVVMWIYEEHGIWINVRRVWNKGEIIGFEVTIDKIDGFSETDIYNSPTEAYYEAILFTLKNLI